MTVVMSSSSDSSSGSSDSGGRQSDNSRLTVADILSNMANGEAVTPSAFATLEGFTTAIPTRTTPTLTPTTLRNIEQTFIELQSVPPPSNHHHQAGFVPPIVNSSSHVPTTTASSYPVIPKEEDSLWYAPASPPPRTASVSSSSGRGKSGRMGGRRPKRDDRLSPEEEERRRVRRERNKLAAARCRKRRLDHTNSLLTETDGLEEKRQELQKEIGELQNQKEHLEFILEAHRCLCKGESSNGKTQTTAQLKNSTASISTTTSYADGSKPLSRPTSLQLPANFTAVPTSTNLRLNTSVSVSEVAGVAISTPSNGMFNFDALMDGGTGLTPISSGIMPIIPTCSSQQRNPNNEVLSPETLNPPKLVSL